MKRESSGARPGGTHNTKGILGAKPVKRAVTHAEQMIRLQRDLTIAMGAALSLEEALEVCIKSSLEISGMACGGVYLSDEDRGEFTLVQHADFPANLIDKVRRVPSNSELARRIRRNKPIFTDFAEFGRWFGGLDDVQERALAIIPIAHENRVIAFTLLISARGMPALSETVSTFLESIAAQAGSFIEHLRVEEALQENRINLQTLFQSLQEFIFIFETEGSLFRFNRAVPLRLGFSEDELLDMRMPDLHPLKRRGEAEAMLEAIRQGKVESATLPLRTSGGGEIPVDTNYTKARWGKREVIFGISRDISERLRAEEAIRRAREQEVEIGARIQNTLLFGTPPTDIPGVAVRAKTIPSQRIDGDFYDFFKIDGRRFDVVIGDVMGKGVAAALLGAAVKNQFLRAFSALRASEEGRIPEPEEILNRVHHAVTPELMDLGSFVTACYARVDLENCTLKFVDCGHTKSMLVSPDSDEAIILQGANVPLGFMVEEEYKQREVSFSRGMSLLLYSDCLTEARSPEGEFYGVERLAETLVGCAGRSPRKQIEEILNSVISFSASEVFSDDLTCISVKWEEVTAESSFGCSNPTARRLEIGSELSELSRVRGFLWDALSSGDFGELPYENVSRMVLGVNEALSNVIRHSHSGVGDSCIQICVGTTEEDLSIEILHQGIEFTPDSPPREPEGEVSGGFGLYIIHRSFDEVSYSKTPDGFNRVLLRKKLPGQWLKS